MKAIMFALACSITLGAFGFGCTANGGDNLCDNGDGIGDAGAGGTGGSGGTTTTSTTLKVVDACEIDECDLGAVIGKQKAACDDGNPKTADRCVWITPECDGGVCSHTEVECDWLDPIESQQATCDDDDACTADRCKEPNVCDHLPISNCP